MTGKLRKNKKLKLHRSVPKITQKRSKNYTEVFRNYTEVFQGLTLKPFIYAVFWHFSRA
nr:MAG TPA: hypothetical protein [Caudoviricetes sp.]